ncbi:hypothetical protein GF380_01850 [Candidatus Uhrbacteria bacterium]|nr:hypothetical protein [Candidatus Uhrbacteria bacterium]MBD3283986.1 hypothetical protein [Candidatus Uhrbacteria bacterium]
MVALTYTPSRTQVAGCFVCVDDVDSSCLIDCVMANLSTIKISERGLLELLNEDVLAFNSYREKYAHPINLNHVDLSGWDLYGVNFAGVSLWNASLLRCDLREASLMDANLTGANLTYATLWDADLEDAMLVGTCLYGADLRTANLKGVKLDGACLGKAIFTAEQLMEIALGLRLQIRERPSDQEQRPYLLPSNLTRDLEED